MATSNPALSLPLKRLVAIKLNRERTDGLLHYKASARVGRNQEALHRSTAFCRLAAGGNQSGKSIWNAAEMAYWLRGKHPWLKVPRPCHVWLVSDSYQTVDQGVYPHLFTSDRDHPPFIPDWCVTHRGPKISGYDIPSYIEVRGADGAISSVTFHSSQGGDKARKRMTSAAIDLLSIDEEVDSGLRDELTARLVNRGGHIIASATMVEGQPWLADMELWAAQGNPDYYCERLRSDYNEYLDPRLLAQWMRELTPEEREIRIFGRSRRASGLVYPDWDARQHVCSSFDIPPDAIIMCSLDPGASVFAGIWVAVCPDGHSYIIDTMYERNAELGEVAQRIREIERWRLLDCTNPDDESSWEQTDETLVPAIRIADRAETRRLMTGEAGVIDQLAAKYGLFCEPSYHGTVMLGVQAARRWYKPRVNGIAGLRIWDSCTNFDDFVREITRYRFVRDTTSFRQHARRDEPIRKANHLMDCVKNLAVIYEDYLAGDIELTPRDPDPVANELIKHARVLVSREEAEKLAAEELYAQEEEARRRQTGENLGDIYAQQFDQTPDFW